MGSGRFADRFSVRERDVTSADDVLGVSETSEFNPNASNGGDVARRLELTLSEGAVDTEIGNEETYAVISLTNRETGARVGARTNEVEVGV